MNRIDQAFADRRPERPLFIPFITAGDPSPDATIDIVKTLVDSGVDMVELGVPYSDPIADGPTIQKASARALKNRITLHDCLQMVETLRREEIKIPILLFSYLNLVLQYGIEPFFASLKSRGGDGVIIPDLPVEESEEINALASKYDMHLISLVAPTSEKRVELISKQAAGFIYCVSSLGVTGIRSTLHPQIESFLKSVRTHAKAPIAVGFGISSHQQIKKLSKWSDGVIVGSSIVNVIEQNAPLLQDAKKRDEGLKNIKKFVRSLITGDKL